MLCHNRSNQAIDVPKKQTIQRNRRRAHGDSQAPNGKKPLFKTNKIVLDSAKKSQCSTWNMRFPLVGIDLRGLFLGIMSRCFPPLTGLRGPLVALEKWSLPAANLILTWKIA